MQKKIIVMAIFLVVGMVSYTWSLYPGEMKIVVKVPQWQVEQEIPQFSNRGWQFAPAQRRETSPLPDLEPTELEKTAILLENYGNYRPFILALTNRQGTQTYRFFTPEKIFDAKGQVYYPEQEQVDQLRNITESLRKQAGFGKLVPWEEVDHLFPKYARATVRDLKTGLEFRVQRRAGSAHADVQPITAQDSQIMKEIYGGKWSWERRAIVVKLGNQEIAASMNGMPHGAGAIGGNDFNGHFCIHFLESSTHVSGVNLAHQIMVWQASGHLPLLLTHCSREASLYILLTALDQSDLPLASLMLTDSMTPEMQKQLARINRLKIEEVTVQKGQVAVATKYILTGSWQTFEKTISFRGRQRGNQWSFELAPLIELVGQPVESSSLSSAGEGQDAIFTDLADWD